MINYFNTKDKRNCNGCGTCALICPQNCITMEIDSEGFIYPVIDEKKCINCNKCKKQCSNINDKCETNEQAYISINKSQIQLSESSSGGVFRILADEVIGKNGIVFGATYDNNLRVIHDCAKTIEECKNFSGSKYVRSDLKESYSIAQKYLDEGKYVLFTGTSCQINGLKKYLNREYEKLILCDIICHANPSPKVFALYKSNLEKKYNQKIKIIHFRSKENGWRNQTPIIEFINGTKLEENSYFNAFVQELINRPSCYSCPFATKRRVSDFTMGDSWGIEKIHPEICNEKGMSLLTVNSSKGEKIFNDIKSQMEIYPIDYNEIAHYNHYKLEKPNKNRNKFFSGIYSGTINENNIIENMNKYTNISFLRKVMQKIKHIIKRG